jgi:hypothetical protein
VDLVLHLHRLDDADHLARDHRVALAHLDGEHRTLHRADDRIAPTGAARSSSGALSPPLSEGGPGRFRHEHLDVEPAAVEFDSRHVLPESAVRPCR